MHAMTRMLTRSLICLLTAVSVCSGVARAEAPVPQPFVATFDVSYRGIHAGSLVFKFFRDPVSGHYIYETRANPTMLARLVVSRAALERSVMEIDENGMRPLQWRLDGGKSGTADDGSLDFDWSRNTATGVVEGKPVNLTLEPGLQDRLSIQIAVVTMLMRGIDPGVIPLIDDERVKRYRYEKKQPAVIDSKLGKLDTIVYESSREGSNRMTRFWLTPKMEFVPARAEQVRKGKVETVMTLVALERRDEVME